VLSQRSCFPVEKRDIAAAAVLTVNRCRPSRPISTQHGAVCRSANGEAPIDESTPPGPPVSAETVPRATPLWAFET
jgi:hypothetical protein